MICLYCKESFTASPILKIFFSFKALYPEKICSICYQNFSVIKLKDHCHTCYINDKGNPCIECQRWQSIYPELNFKHSALFHYNTGMKDWMSMYKFSGHSQLASCFSIEIKEYLEKYLLI